MSTENVANIYELSPVQQGMLFHTLLSPPESGMYFLQTGLALEGDLDVVAFEAAWQRLVARHDIFRTGFYWEEMDKPLQVVYREVDLSLEKLDWRHLSPTKQEARLQAFMEADRLQGIDLGQAPILRLTLIRLAPDLHQLVWSSHYLLLDGWSMALVVQELFMLYEMARQGQPLALEPPRSFGDYILWLQEQDLSQAQAFWGRHLAGVTAPTPLGIDRRLGEVEHYREHQARLPAGTTARLQDLAREHQLTLNTLLQAAWGLLLHRYSGERSVVFGVVVSGRPPSLPGVELIVGPLINTLPLHVRVPAGARLVPWLKEVQARQVEMREYEYSPLVDVQGWSQVPRGQPLFESIFIFENYPVSSSLEDERLSLRVRQTHTFDITNYPLTLTVLPGPELGLVASYDGRRFEPAAITRMLGHFESLLAGMVQQPDAPLDRLPLLTGAERAQLAAWNDTAVDYAQPLCVHQLFERQAARTPQAEALLFEGQRLTYAELNRRANRLAHYLAGLGVGPETLVGVCLERSVEMVVALLGALKAGGAYVPLDPGYPAERLAFMLQDARAPVLLTQAHLLDRLPPYTGWVLCLDRDWDEVAGRSGANLPSQVVDDNLAYVIYTSGSTGRPKGAMNTHGALRNRLLWMQETYRLGPDDRVLQKTPFSFDVSVWEFFWPLMIGACLVVARPEGHKDSAYLVRTIVEQEISTLHFVPSMLQAFVAERGLEVCTSLKRVISSGEALPYDLQQRFFGRLDADLHNLYGPTEAAIDVTFWPCRPDGPEGSVPIGRPIANTQIYLLDSQLRPVPPGVPGELHIGGVGLARGYWGRPALTAETFIPNPFARQPGERLYKTGDLARYRPDGSIEYIGRLDFQVKLRGFRIELGEIETALNRHPAVDQAVSLVREDRLTAYYVPRDGQEPSQSELRRFLGQRLPEHMVPAILVALDALPLTPNGKIDRRALPAPEQDRSALEGAYVAPRTDLERALAAIWEEVLGVPTVGLQDNFFELGGNSLLCLQVISRAGREGVALSLGRFLQEPTVAGLARAADGQDQAVPGRLAESGPASIVVRLQPGQDRPPLFLVHPSSGDVLCFLPLARHLGAEYPVYGIESPDLHTDAPPMTDVQHMAARYVEAVRAVQAGGPYYLGGWSGGGNIALEMAIQLHQAEEPVAFLGLVDALPHVGMLSTAAALVENYGWAARLYQLGGESWKGLWHKAWRKGWGLLGRRMLDRSQRANQVAALMMYVRFFEETQWGRSLDLSPEALERMPPEAQFGHIRERLQALGVESPQEQVQTLRRLTEVTLANSQAVDAYEPEAVYPGPVTFFRAEQGNPDEVIDASTFFDGPALGWQKYLAQPVEVHVVPGHHYALMDEPYVGQLAAEMRACLERAQARVAAERV